MKDIFTKIFMFGGNCNLGVWIADYYKRFNRNFRGFMFV